MSVLPVIDRELRVRARLNSTMWFRLIVGLLASLTAISIASWAGRMQGPMKPGRTLFDTLGALAFVFCLVEGVRQTADSLSREKREGTIGLLFLTDLRAVDIVLGKLVSASVNSFYGLLAVFPAMALALPAGGLSAGEFWRTQLALLDALFLATACGLWVSARHLEETRTLVRGLGLIFGLTIVPAMFEAALRAMSFPTVSPAVAMHLAGNDAAYRAAPERFWWSLLSIQGLGWMLLFWTARRLSHTWNEEPNTAPEATSSRDVEATPHATPTGEHVNSPNRALLDESPAVWLARRQKGRRAVIWIAILLIVFGTGGLLPLLIFLARRVSGCFMPSTGPRNLFLCFCWHLSVPRSSRKRAAMVPWNCCSARHFNPPTS
jgi:ABC-type transport system involved in multi-copper enzyme maturation permease subunit